MSSAKQSDLVLGNVPTTLAQPKEPPNYLTLKEVAELLKVKPRTVYAWVSDNRIPFERKVVFCASDLMRWCLERTGALTSTNKSK